MARPAKAYSPNLNSTRVGGYGPLLGYDAPALTLSGALADSLVWRTRRVDPSGFYWMGARYYEPVSGRFLSPDPAGHGGSWDLYSFANGDPINQFDPDGRFSKGIHEGYSSGVQRGGDSGAFGAGYWMGGVFNGGAEGFQGGASITANTLTFGVSDAAGWTQSGQYQGWEYTSSRVLSTMGREMALTAATLGAAQAYRATGYGLYGALAAGGELYTTYQNLDGMAAGFENLAQGNMWGALQVGVSSLGLRGNYVAATQLTGYRLAVDSTRLGTPLGNLKAVPIGAAEGIPRITEKGLARVESHLDDVLNNQFGDLSRSTGLKFQAGERGMLERLRSGATSPQDIEFYMHELRESARFRSSGDLMKAHNEALQWRGVTSQDLFHREVMQANPQIFGGRP